MRSALFAVAVTALAAGLTVTPVTGQSAQASVYGGVKSGVPAPVAGDLILVGKGGRGGGGRGAFKGGGGGFKGAHRGGGRSFHRGGGSKHVYRGGGGKRYAHRGGGHSKYWSGGGKGKKHYNRHYSYDHYKGRRYYRGRYYNDWWWYGPSVAVGAYGYGGCAWLRRQAIATGSPYWWDRYYDCVGYY